MSDYDPLKLADVASLQVRIEAILEENRALKQKLGERERQRGETAFLKISAPLTLAVSKLDLDRLAFAYMASSSIETIARSTVAEREQGFIEYHRDYCIDRWASLELHHSEPMHVAELLVPMYYRHLQVPLPLPSDKHALEQKTRLACWNCASIDHQLSDCPYQRNQHAISAKRNEFLDDQAKRKKRQKRYFDDVKENKKSKNNNNNNNNNNNTFNKTFVAGKWSNNLLDALGVLHNKQLPSFVSEMQTIGSLGPTYAQINAQTIQPSIEMPGFNATHEQQDQASVPM